MELCLVTTRESWKAGIDGLLKQNVLSPCRSWVSNPFLCASGVSCTFQLIKISELRFLVQTSTHPI